VPLVLKPHHPVLRGIGTSWPSLLGMNKTEYRNGVSDFQIIAECTHLARGSRGAGQDSVLFALPEPSTLVREWWEGHGDVTNTLRVDCWPRHRGGCCSALPLDGDNWDRFAADYRHRHSFLRLVSLGTPASQASLLHGCSANCYYGAMETCSDTPAWPVRSSGTVPPSLRTSRASLWRHLSGLEGPRHEASWRATQSIPVWEAVPITLESVPRR